MAAKTERRKFLRSAYKAEVECRLDSEPIRLFVYDLSMDGCSIETEDARITEGVMVDLNFVDDLTVRARVLWRRNLNAGLQFNRRLTSRAVKGLIERNGSVRSTPESSLSRSARLKSSRSVTRSKSPAL